MKLQDAKNQFIVSGLDKAHLRDQDDAFQQCKSFFDSIEKTKTQNNKHGSYGLKHLIENPSGRFGIPGSDACYFGYIYEGTLILAALASGFKMQQKGKILKATFNISERSLRERTKELAEQRQSRTANCEQQQ